MGRTAITILLSLAVVLHSTTAIRFAANDEAPVEPASIRPSKSAHQLSNLHQKEWLAGPNGYLYQFHAGDQSWLAAREYCLAQNSDLVILRDAKQIDWLLDHYAPTYARFAERYIQIGLMIPDGPSRDWMYLDGSKYNQSVISWMSGEPFDHTTDGRERCALLRVHARVLDDVDCEASPRNQMPVRFICERSDVRHKEQQLSKNFIWGKLEQLLEYFGFGNSTPSKKVNSTSVVDEDYVDEVSKLNITSTEREMLKKIRLFETSSEEEREVLSALRNLNNPGSTAGPETSSTSEVTSPDALQEVRPKTSTEIESTGSTTVKTQSTTEELPTTETVEETTTSGSEVSSTVDNTTADSTTEESTTQASTTEESRSTTGESNAETSTVQESTTDTTVGDERTNEVPTTEESTTEVPTTVETASEVLTTAESSTNEPATEKTKKPVPARALAVPLREITETEGSGAAVDKSQIEKESSKHQHEIDPEKLEKIINTMEKMVANLENISIIEKRPDIKSEAGKDQGQAEKEIRKKEATKEDSQKSETRKKVKANDALVSISQPDNENGADQADMEKDFDEKLNKKMPTTDIKPPVDEDCEEGASGEKPTTQTPPEAVVRNAIDTEDVDDLSQKPKIPVEREEHIQDFLRTLRTFLSRAEHNDLRKLLDNNPGKSLLEKMKLAIAAANEREFARLKELELMKKHGVDISNVPEPQLIADSEREDLFKKISGVVMEEAEKQGLETATEPSARTTTQETSRSTTEGEETRTSAEPSSTKEPSTEEKHEKEADKGADSQSMKDGKSDEVPSQDSSKSTENHTKGTEKPEKEDDPSTEEPFKEESTTESKTSAEMPVRTVQLKEFDNKEEIMSHEVKREPEEKPEKESEPEIKVNGKETKKEDDEKEIKEEEEEVMKTEAIKTENEDDDDDDMDEQPASSNNAGEKKSNEEDDDIAASNEIHRSKSREEPEEEVPSTQVPKENDDDHGVEVGTEKTPQAKRAERMRLAREKKAQLEKAKEVKKAEESSSEEDEHDSTNPLGLPTLPPPPTLAPLPSLETVLDNLGKQWKKLFPPPKSFRV